MDWNTQLFHTRSIVFHSCQCTCILLFLFFSFCILTLLNRFLNIHGVYSLYGFMLVTLPIYFITCKTALVLYIINYCCICSMYVIIFVLLTF